MSPSPSPPPPSAEILPSTLSSWNDPDSNQWMQQNPYGRQLSAVCQSLVHRARQAMRHHMWWWEKLGIILQTSIRVVHNIRVRQDFAEDMVWATFLKQRLCQTNKGHGEQRDHTATVLRAIPWKWVHQPATNISTRTCTNETSMPS